MAVFTYIFLNKVAAGARENFFQNKSVRRFQLNIMTSGVTETMLNTGVALSNLLPPYLWGP